MKRFTETTKWHDPWYRRLSPAAKLLWSYLTDNCDCAGLIDLDIEAAAFHIGCNIAEKHLTELVDRVQRTEDGKLFIPRFIPFQYGTISETCPAHKPVIKLITERNLSMNGKGYQYPIPTLPLALPKATGIGKGKEMDMFGKCENLFFGNVPEDLIELAPRLMPTEKAGEWQDYVQAEITELGYCVTREVVCSLEEGTGRIDLVAEKEGNRIAIELDYRTPRAKSIRKVQTYPAGMVLLRDPKIVRLPGPTADDIYAVYPLKVGKPDAIRAIVKAMMKDGGAVVLERTQAYAKVRNGNLEFVPNPATWFNQERYNDNPKTWEPKENNGAHQRNSTESNRNLGTANEGKSSQYRDVGKLRPVPNPERPTT